MSGKSTFDKNVGLGDQIAGPKEKLQRGCPSAHTRCGSCLFAFSAGGALRAAGPADSASVWRRTAGKLQPGSVGWARRRGAAFPRRGLAPLADAGRGPAQDGVRGPAGLGGPGERRAVGIGGEMARGLRPRYRVNARGTRDPWGARPGGGRSQDSCPGGPAGLCREGPRAEL